MKKFVLPLFLCCIGYTFNSCVLPYPNSSELSADVATLTTRDSTQDFGVFKTYAMPSQIYWVNSDSSLTPVEQQYAQQIINAFNTQMTSRGYTKVDASADPDLLVNITALENLYVIYYPGGGYNYYDCIYWGYNCGWWYYPTYPTVSTYKTGSLIIDLVDRRHAIDGNLGYFPVPWEAVVYALSTSNPQYDTDKALKGVNNAFIQSPYLKTN